MSHTWKHKQEEEALAKYPEVSKRMQRIKKNKTGDVQYEIDLGELADKGYDVEGLFKGTSLANLEKRLGKKKF